ncbi:ubiquitin-related domain-containing protein [Mycena vulgaris]|nr:ubiquitin-related domain-containing protein [Mycena vulgaris]
MATRSLDLLPPPHAPYTSSARTSTTRVDIDMENDDPTAEPQSDVLLDPAPAPQAPEPEPVPQTPQTALTFLLISGRRRTMAFDPATTVARVKELVWSAWPSEWQDDRPPAPSYLRILYLGKILQDDDTLTALGFPSHTPLSASEQQQQQQPPLPPPTIVHLSVRAYAPPPDDALKKKKSSRRAGRTATDAAGNPTAAPAADGADEDAGGCCCVVC